MENNIKRGVSSTCIALHDFSIPTPDLIHRWFEYMEMLFSNYGLVPNRAGLDYFERKSPAKSISFKVAKKRLYEQKFEDIKSLELNAMPPDYRTEMFDYIYSVWLKLSKKEQENGCFISFDSDIFSFEKNCIMDLLSQTSSLLKQRYGYVYKRRFSHGPMGYCVGMIGDNDRKNRLSKEERQWIMQWADHVCSAYRDSSGKVTDLSKYKTGDMRDIYPGNILSKAHADHVVDGLPLLDWIASKPYRGTLTTIQENLWLWWVDDEHIPTVREELRSTGFVICI